MLAGSARPTPTLPDGIVGRASGIQTRTQVWSSYSRDGGSSTHSREILNFRIEREGGAQPVVVQLKGLEIEGVVSDGDCVEVQGPAQPGKVLKTKRVENLTTGVPVVAKGYPTYVKVLMVPAVGFILGIWGFLAYQFLSGP